MADSYLIRAYFFSGLSIPEVKNNTKLTARLQGDFYGELDKEH